MFSKAEAAKRSDGDSANAKLLLEVEKINKTLYSAKNPPRGLYSASNARSKSAGKNHLMDSKSKPKYAKEDPEQKEKKSIWSWKALKSLSHIRNRRFNCCFSLHVHLIEGLPSNLNDSSLTVHWKRKDGELVTHPARVSRGIAEFEEKLNHTCSVYGSRNGPHHSAKYEAKHFLLYASVFGAPELDLGKHRVDLTKLLPVTLEELEDDKSSGKWTTSFKLAGKAKGATMNVSFGYVVIRDNFIPPTNKNVPELFNLKQNNLSIAKSVTKFDQGANISKIKRGGSLPENFVPRHPASSQSVEGIKILHEVLPMSRSELSSSLNLLYQKLDECKLDASVDYRPELDNFSEPVEALKPNSNSLPDSSQQNIENEGEDNEFSVIEQGIEILSKELVRPEEDTVKASNVSAVGSLDIVDINSGINVVLKEDPKLDSQDEEYGSSSDKLVIQDCESIENDLCTKESLMKELDSVLNSMSNLETEALDFLKEDESHMEVKSNYKTDRKGKKALSLDDVTESVASEFLDMLGIEHSPFGLSSESEPESPRERLLRQFEKDTLASGCSLFDFDVGDGNLGEFSDDAPTGYGLGNLSEDFKISSAVQAPGDEHWLPSQVLRNNTRAKVLEDLETEALMREWGLNEKAFQGSPRNSSGGFGSPINPALEEPLQLPDLGEGLGPFIQTKNGGFVRSMNPSLFKNAKSGGSLIMQVSSPVVVPADMGSGIMDILQNLASVGIEKLSTQANKLMPLEDITGRTMQQIAWETVPSLEAPERQSLLQLGSEAGQDVTGGQKRVTGKSSASRSNKLNSSSLGSDVGSEYVSLEDLAPLAMDKIEALSIEGLRIQSGMVEEDAPSNISAQSIGEISALKGKGVNITGSLGLEGAAGLQLLDIKDVDNDLDGLMGLSLTLDEWMRLESGEIGDKDQISERTSKILAAHHANSLEFIRGGSKGERRRGRGSGRKCGLLENNFTVALMVQLRDPLRNYEPVGTPMLALIQVERVFVPPKPKIYSTVSLVGNSKEEDDESVSVAKEDLKDEKKEEQISEEEAIPQFKITEVHVAGLKTEPGKKKLWGTSTQQQSGSRWLLANGMGKNNKHPFMKSKAVSKSTSPATTTVQPGETLWSISSRVHGTGAKWKELAALNPHIRNPNVIFPNETIRLC